MTTFTTYFTDRATSKNLTAGDMLAHALLKAIRAKHEDKEGLAQILVDKAFRAPTNKNRIFNGHLSWWGFHQARYQLVYGILKAPAFELTEYEVTMLTSLAKSLKAPK
jgi:hypothetical protein